MNLKIFINALTKETRCIIIINIIIIIQIKATMPVLLESH